MKWKKNRRLHVLLFLLVIFSLTVLSVAMAFAATGDKKDVTCGTFWPPEEGYYVRRNSSGIVNGMMNVIVPGKYPPLIGIQIFNAEDNKDTKTGKLIQADSLPYNYGVWFGGTIQPAQAIFATRMVQGAYTKTFSLHGDVTQTIPLRNLPNYKAQLCYNRIILSSFPGVSFVPDVAGEYIREDVMHAASPDVYMAVALLEMLPFSDTQLEFWSGNYEMQLAELVHNSGIFDVYPQLGNIGPGFEIKVLRKDTGKLHYSFVIKDNLKEVYRVAPDGSAVLIYNINGAKG